MKEHGEGIAVSCDEMELKREALKRNSMEQRRVDVSWNSAETEEHRDDRRWKGADEKWNRNA